MIIIAGAGIAGLTLANALEQANQPYVVLDSAPELKPIGAGIMLQNNGLAVLSHLGLTPYLQGKEIQALKVGLPEHLMISTPGSSGLKAMLVTRGVLQHALLKKLPSKRLCLNQTITSVLNRGDGVEVRFASGETVKCRAFVNAAGIHSNFHGEPELRYSGQWCWRALLPYTGEMNSFGEYWFGQQRVGFGAVNGQQVYMFHVIDQVNEVTASEITDEQRVDWITGQTKRVPAFSQLDFSNVHWLSHPLQDRAIHWGGNRVVAIGDAAHAVTPNLGQGAVIAMEDALVLAELIQTGATDLAGNMKRIRHKRIKGVQRNSWWMGRVAHTDNRLIRLAKKWVSKVPSRGAVKQQVRWMNQFSDNHLRASPKKSYQSLRSPKKFSG